MKIFRNDHFPLPLPEGHRFPEGKYRLLRSMVEESGLVPEADLVVPPASTDRELATAHEGDYVRAAVDGTLPERAWRRIGFPWSPELVERTRRSVAGTVEAARAALEDGGVAVHLAGGTHHAFRDRGEGYCVFNDAAVAVRALQAEARIRRAVILDCDVHQGNGTAAIFEGDPSVFTFSIHGATNFPFRKERSDLDIALPDRTGDAAYIEALRGALPRAIDAARPDLAIYLAGADPWENDRLGKLALTIEGLGERDRLVLGACRRHGIPVAIAMSGGYARRPEDTARIHLQTVRIAAGAA